MNHKIFLIDELLNGTKNSYKHLNEESRLYLLQILNIYATNNKGIFCLEKKALKRYHNIVNSLGHLGYDTLFAYTFINDLKITLNDKKKSDFYLDKFIFDTLFKYKNENEIVKHKILRVEQIRSHIKKLFHVINYLIPYIDGLYLPTDKGVTSEWLENSLKFLIKNNESDILKYYDFINFYYEKTGVNLLGKASNNNLKFSLKLVKNGR